MSIQSMIDAALPGDTVSVPPGTYNEQLLIDKPLTLTGPDPSVGAATVDAAGLAAEPTLLITSDQVIIRSLTFQNGPGPGIRIGTASFPNLQEVLIEKCVIRGHDLAGILSANSSAADINSNLIENNGNIPSFQRAGILLYPHGETRVRNNHIHDNGDNGDGIFARASSAGLLIENNRIENELNSGITLAWDERNVTIRENTISYCGTDTDDLKGGLVIVQSMSEQITGNTITNCRQRALMWVWVPTVGPEPDEVLIRSNNFGQSSYDGIYLFSQGPGSFMPPDLYPLKPRISENRIAGNSGAGVFISNAYLGYPTGTAEPHLDCNRILENGWGVFNQTAATINGVNNWWGDRSGPYHPLTNPEGLGNPVSDRVDFIPWCTSPPLPEPTEIDCILANKIYWRCQKHPVSEQVTDVAEMAAEEIRKVKCLKVSLLDDPLLPIRVEKIPGTDRARVSFYFEHSVLFKDGSGWKVANNPPVLHEEVFKLPMQARDPRLDLSANIYLQCLECFLSGDHLITCCIGILVLLQLVSEVQLLIPTCGFPPEPEDCRLLKKSCPPYSPACPPYPEQ